MKIMTSQKGNLVGAVLLGALVAVIAGRYFWLEQPTSVAFTENQSSVTKAVKLSTSTIPLRVSGVVSAVDSTIVYAETAGVVSGILVREGGVVKTGDLLARQSSPVLDAEWMLANAQASLIDLQQLKAVEEMENRAAQAEVRTYTATEIATLRNIGTNNRIEEAANSLVIALQSSALTATEAINYVNNNRTLFDAEGLRLYDQVVTDLYGIIPNYFRGGVMYPVKSNQDVLEMLKEIKANSATAPLAIQEVSTLVKGQLDALSNILTTAEADIFDRKAVLVTAASQAEYLAIRTKVLVATQSLQSVQSPWQQVLDGALEEAVTLGTEVVVTDIDRKIADAQAKYLRLISAQSMVVSQSQTAVVSARQSLGQPKAPFAGVVSHVYVKEGEYVQPGTPLVKLVGSGARELEVSAPTYLLADILVGQPFVVENTVVGFVSRFSLVSEGGSGLVVIALNTEEVPAVGSSVVGSLMIDTMDLAYSVPRPYVHFASNGPYLRYISGEHSLVEIIYDTGDTLFLKVSEPSDEALVAASSITL